MTYAQIVPAALPAITLSQAKTHLRITHSDEDAFIEGLVSAATDFIERETGVAMITQTWRLWLDTIPADGIVHLPRHPVQRVVQVTVHDREGTPTVMEGSAYFLNMVTRPARLRFSSAISPTRYANGIEIDFDCGYGNLGPDVPDLLKRAVLALVAHWYEYRGVYGPDDQPVAVPEAARVLYRHYQKPGL